MGRQHLVIRTEAESQRDHALTWIIGFGCGIAFCVSTIILWKVLL